MISSQIESCKQGYGVVRSRRFLGGVGFFCPTLTPEVQLDHILHHTPKLGAALAMAQFLMKLLLEQRILVVYHDLH